MFSIFAGVTSFTSNSKLCFYLDLLVNVLMQFFSSMEKPTLFDFLDIWRSKQNLNVTPVIWGNSMQNFNKFP